jgi:uncharacterized membrane protein
MHVVEHITYDFTGKFSFGTRPIPGGAYQITDMTVSEHGRPLPSEGAPWNLKWFFSAEDEQRTFDIAYTVVGATQAGSDVDQLYWKWVGDAHPTIDHVSVRLTVPPGTDRLRAWGHGPLNGVVRVGADTVRWRASGVPQGTFVEGRVAIPPSRLPELRSFGLPGPSLAQIVTQETAWADAANAARRAAASDAEEERRWRERADVAVPIVTALGALAFLLVWLRWGREPRKPDDIGQYLRELPDDPPAVVDALLHWGSVRPVALSATLLDLARRGHLTIAEEREDRRLLPDKIEYRLTRTDKPVDDLKEFERNALTMTFAAGPSVTQGEIVADARAHQTESAARWQSFKSSVGASLRARAYINGGRSAPFLLNILTVLVVGAAGVAGIALHSYVAGGVALAWAAVQLCLTPLLRQRTPKGSRRHEEWLAVRRFLHDFSQLDEAPVGHLTLWEQYLVYAVALGVSGELARGLALKVPEVASDPQFAPWYVTTHDTRGFSGFGAFGGSFGGAVATASTPPSSGSGGGGGFSGGGGGGGGGGGIGAG